MMRKGARVVATEVLREPVKEAVREALREETASVSSASGEIETNTSSAGRTSEGRRGRESDQRSEQQSGSQGGRSKLTTLGLLLAVVGLTYVARQRMSSTGGSAWSEQSAGSVATDDTEGGYVSEGEMQTAETAGESTDPESTGTSASTNQ
jgi:hypothetical protein